MYKAQPHKRAAKYYKSLDDKTARRINRAVEEIMKNPREGQHIKNSWVSMRENIAMRSAG